MRYALGVSVLLFAFLLVAGCTESAPVETPTAVPPVVDGPAVQEVTEPVHESPDISGQLASINTALENGIMGVDDAFHSFDRDFAVNNWFYGTIMGSQLANMEKTRNDVSTAMDGLSGTEADYNALMATVDKSSLSGEENALVTGIETKINQFNTPKAKIEVCVDKMSNYTEFVRLLQENVILNERLETENTMLTAYINGEEYTKARNQVTRTQKTIGEMKANIAARDALGVQGDLSSSDGAADLLIEAYDIYKELIVALEKEDAQSSEEKYAELNAKLAETLAAEDPNLSSPTYQLNLVDQWYSINIGVCVGVFST